ncbi:MAG: GIY-YIG nuclease family protein [Cytophagales bacterium]|jgi:Meiotically up-regulated gene 113|nr:GIY-YIG nuclease family protein [Cytophagales bacterium]
MKIVYILYNRNHQAVKIGYASDINSRISSIQTSTPEKLCLMFTFEGGKELEKHFHSELKQFHIKGEWFKYNEAVKNFLLRYQEYQLEFFESNTDEKSVHNIQLTLEDLNHDIIKFVKNCTTQFTIPDIKRQLPDLTLTTKQIENILLLNGFVFKQYGTSRKKYFHKK